MTHPKNLNKTLQIDKIEKSHTSTVIKQYLESVRSVQSQSKSNFGGGCNDVYGGVK